MSTLAERAHAIAQAAKARDVATAAAGNAPRRLDPERDRWIVNKPDGPVLVIFNPPQTQSVVRRIFYPGCGVLPADVAA